MIQKIQTFLRYNQTIYLKNIILILMLISLNRNLETIKILKCRIIMYLSPLTKRLKFQRRTYLLFYKHLMKAIIVFLVVILKLNRTNSIILQ